MPLPLLIRRTHAYISTFLAPTVLFLAVTGVLQVYNFHEDHGAYTAPVILEKLSSVHKDQVWRAPRKHDDGPPPAAAAPSAPGPVAAPAPPKPHRPTPAKVVALKAFEAAGGVLLSLSTLLGVWMAVRYTRQPRLCATLFVLGVLVPLATFALP